MQVVIPTYGRADFRLQHTLRQLHEEGIHSHLVVQNREAHMYKDWTGPHKLVILPAHITTISPTRDWIIHDMEGSDLVVMMDDDLQFACRRTDDPTKFRQPEPGDLTEMLLELQRLLALAPMCGIGSREGGNRNIEPLLWNTRTMRVLGFNRKVIKDLMFTCHPMEVMEDFHLQLQLLRAGFDIPQANRWVSNQAGGSGAPGGCSAWRTRALQAANAHRLAGLHPGYVKVVQKAANSAWGGDPRTDVTVYWKKARGA